MPQDIGGTRYYTLAEVRSILGSLNIAYHADPSLGILTIQGRAISSFRSTGEFLYNANEVDAFRSSSSSSSSSSSALGYGVSGRVNWGNVPSPNPSPPANPLGYGVSGGMRGVVGGEDPGSGSDVFYGNVASPSRDPLNYAVLGTVGRGDAPPSPDPSLLDLLLGANLPTPNIHGSNVNLPPEWTLLDPSNVATIPNVGTGYNRTRPVSPLPVPPTMEGMSSTFFDWRDFEENQEHANRLLNSAPNFQESKSWVETLRDFFGNLFNAENPGREEKRIEEEAVNLFEILKNLINEENQAKQKLYETEVQLANLLRNEYSTPEQRQEAQTQSDAAREELKGARERTREARESLNKKNEELSTSKRSRPFQEEAFEQRQLGTVLGGLGFGKASSLLSGLSEVSSLRAKEARGDPDAGKEAKAKELELIARTAREQFDKFVEGAGKVLHSNTVGNVIGGQAQALGVVGGPMLAIPSLFVQVLAESVDSLQKWNHEIKNSNLQFSEFSSSMALVGAEETVRNISLSRERGERRGGTARMQAASSFELDKRLSIFEDAIANMKNVGSSWVSDSAVKVIDLLADTLPWAAKWLRKVANADDFDNNGVFLGPNEHKTIDDMIRSLENNKTLDRPPRFR